ncbi:MAG: dihydroorotase [bacterium]
MSDNTTSSGQSWYIRGARIVDPATKRDEIADFFFTNGIIAATPRSPPAGAVVINGEGLVLTPGFIDLHVHLREPGGEAAETIESGSKAAARGGFTTIVSMPNTTPPIDTPELVEFVVRRAAEAGLVRVLPSGCISVGRKGVTVADLAGMAAAGAAAFTDDGAVVANDDVMRSAMQIAGRLGRPVMDHALDPALSGSGVMHQGPASIALGLAGIPSSAETTIVERDVALAASTGCRVHIQHISAAGSVDIIRDALARSLPVSCEVTPHHLTLCDNDVRPDNTSTKVSPPLRSDADRKALVAGIQNGIVQALATDHAPHTAASKRAAFEKAPFGMTGLETAIGVTYTTLVRGGLLSLSDWVRLWTTGPAGILGIRTPSMEAGRPADVVLLDLASEWEVQTGSFFSKSTNSPFTGRVLTGAAARTFCGGRLTWDREAGHIDKGGRT